MTQDGPRWSFSVGRSRSRKKCGNIYISRSAIGEASSIIHGPAAGNLLFLQLIILLIRVVVLARAALAVLHTMAEANVVAAEDDLWSIGARALAAAFRRDEDIEEAWHKKASNGDEDDAVADEEAPDLERVGAIGRECRIGKGEDDGEDGRANVAHDDAPDPGDGPVVAGCDGDVEVAPELVALWSFGSAARGMVAVFEGRTW